MHHEILTEIGFITPLDALEQQHLDDALMWVQSGAELCRITKPATPPKHLVAYFAVIDTGHILLVDHKNAQLWLPPGGHVEPGEHPRTTVAREIKEELGMIPPFPIDPPIMLTCTTTVGYSAGHTDVSLWYVVQINGGQIITYDANEFHSVQWFPFHQIPLERSDPHLGRFLKKLDALG